MNRKETCMKKLQFCRVTLCLMLTAVLVAAAAYVLKTAASGFTYDKMIQGLRALMLLLIFPAGLGVITAVLAKKYAVPVQQRVRRATPYREGEMPARMKNILRGAVIALAFLMIALGIVNGGLWDVLVKAINICTECIGLG